VFFVLDVSESMAGDEIYQLDEGVRTVLTVIRKNPHCLETVWLSTIVFAGKAQTLVPLTEVVRFVPPELPIGGGTSLGVALEHLMSELDANLVANQGDTKGDWKPLIFLMTDGYPTDQPQAAIERWKSHYSRRANLIAVSIGGQANHEMLSQLTENVIVYYDSTPDSFARFIAWISQSIQAQSQSVIEGRPEGALMAACDEEIIVRLEKSASNSRDEPQQRYVSIVGRCETNKQMYLAKYERDPIGIAALALPEGIYGEYLLKSNMPLRESYLELSDEGAAIQLVDMNSLLGQPDCPHCGAAFSMAIDGECGNVHCVNGPGMHACPWCGSVGEYGLSDGDGELIARRGQG